MVELRIEDVLASRLVDPGAHLDPERVQHYVRKGTDVPPVVFFDTEDGLLLVDGYHRVAAAKARDAATIAADVHHGSRAEALEYAATLAAAGRGISLESAR